MNEKRKERFELENENLKGEVVRYFLLSKNNRGRPTTRTTKTEIRELLFGLFCKHVDIKNNIYSQGKGMFSSEFDFWPHFNLSL